MVRESGLIVLRISRPTPNVDQELSGATTTDLKQANVAGELHPDTANYPIGGAVVISMGLERRPCCIANDAASITHWLRDVPTRAFIAMDPPPDITVCWDATGGRNLYPSATCSGGTIRVANSGNIDPFSDRLRRREGVLQRHTGRWSDPRYAPFRPRSGSFLSP